MRRKTKDIGIYILMNLIVLILICIAVLVLFSWLKVERVSVLPSEEKVNAVIYNTQVELEKKEENVENIQVVMPIISEQVETEIVQEEIVNVAESEAFKFYYYQLSDNAKIIYNVIEENMDNMKRGSYVMELPKTVGEVLRQENGQDKLNEDFQSAWDAIIMDRVELFYVDISKITLNIQTITRGDDVKYNLSMGPGLNENYLEDGFGSEQAVNNALVQVRSLQNQITISATGSDYDKVMQMHNWLVDNLDYGTDVAGNSSYNIYGAFCIRNVVCEGYAEAFKYLLDKLGIPCILVSGTAQNSEGSTENHEWNYVQLDGKWYAVDVTWDDPIIMGGGFLSRSSRYKYFLKGNQTMNVNHFTNGQVSSKGMVFNYPRLEEADY